MYLQPGAEFPKGKFRLPIIGTLYGNKSRPYKAAHDLSIQLGTPIIGGQAGPRIQTILIQDADIIEEVFVKQGHKINGRTILPYIAATRYVR